MGAFVVKRTCAFCRGYGRIGTPEAFKPNSNLCPVCRGRGYNEFIDNIRFCPACGGSGLEQGGADSRHDRCPSCGGTGWIPYGDGPVIRR